uniref:Uncharacterized protein n=1 Tax=Spongospora subterranea TaxID=70186 RepID=A0A0H5QYX3_9EUKA|eukprot:CRZ07183.1 hypothetical protein [Spongospora subterranea]
MPFLLGLTHMDLWQNSDEISASNSKIRVRQHVGISGFLSLLVLQSLQIPMHLRCSGRSPRSCTTCDIPFACGNNRSGKTLIVEQKSGQSDFAKCIQYIISLWPQFDDKYF